MGLTLYFVGAGLTKSLEMTRRIPMMMDFVPVLTDHVNSDVVLNTLVQMEIGKVYETACEDCFSLADKIRDDVPAVAKTERDRFAALVRNRQPESIEALFGRVASMSPNTVASSYAFGLPDLFRYAINQVFSTIGWDLKLSLLTRFLDRQFNEDAGRAHVFVSFNYDLALDRAVEIASGGMWRPRDGYGFEFPFFTIDNGATERCTVELAPGSPRIRILKPHGSLNWLRRRPNGVVSGGSGIDAPHMVIPLNMIPPNNWELRYWPGSDPFAGEIMIAPPSPTKPLIMPQVRFAVSDAVSTADEVFVVGYSFPETDDDQRNLVREAVKRRTTVISALTIINRMKPEDLPKYIENVEGLFQRRTTGVFNGGFADFSARGNGFESALGA